MNERSLLEIKNLQTFFFTSDGVARAVDGVTFEVYPGETLGIVGESGCGKSVTALSILRLIPQPPGRIVGGEIIFEGRDLLTLTEDEMRRVRGDKISMIFQEPMTSLNPVFTIGNQISEVLRLHRGMSRKEAMARSIEMLDVVGIPDSERRVHEYPHQLSGGMRQRAMIAMALACRPRLLIADEPTTALDVTIQAQILELMQKLKDEFDTAIILITHDLSIIAETADRVVVMYAGKMAEKANVHALFKNPMHPYTQELLKSLPRIKEKGEDTGKRLHEIPGVVPNIYDLPAGCKFSPRCPVVLEKCHQMDPPFLEVAPNQWASCWVAQKDTE